MGTTRRGMAKKSEGGKPTSTVGVEHSEWMCRKHGFQIPPKDPKNAKCRYCGSELTLNTWTMSGGKK